MPVFVCNMNSYVVVLGRNVSDRARPPEKSLIRDHLPPGISHGAVDI